MRKIIIAILAGTALLLLGYVSYRGYHVWKQNNWTTIARSYAAKADGRNEGLCLQQVLRINSKNLEACRMMAGLTEAGRSPGALVWRQRVVELNPRSTDDRLALAKTALVLGDYGSATNALAGLDEAAKKTYAYHNLAGNVGIALRQSEVAQAHFSEAARLEPWNSIPQLNLAVVRLQGTNDLDLAEARIALKRVSLSSTNLDLRCVALRALVSDAMRFAQTDTALALSAELLKQTNSVFRDRLLRLDVLQAAKNAGFKPALAGCQREAEDNAGKIYELATWQMAKTGTGPALTWLKSLPMESQTNQAVAIVMAEGRSQQQDWRGLQTTLEKQSWGELEFIRYAFLTRALRRQDLAASAKGAWGQARQATGNQQARLTMLMQFAAQAKWNSEAEEILWTIVNQYPEDQAAFQALAQAFYQSGRTRPLMSLYILQAKRNPANLGVKNNLAMTALLLDAQELKPHDLARDAYQQAATNAAYASTYAFALHLQGKNADALKIFQTLKPKQLEDPGIAGYYGLILSATGDKAKARVYLDWAFKNPMLPEEKKLFERAKAG